MGLISNGTTVFDAGAMSLGGSMTFMKKLTASNSATLSFVHGSGGVDFSTYKEYMFTFKNIHAESAVNSFNFIEDLFANIELFSIISIAVIIALEATLLKCEYDEITFFASITDFFKINFERTLANVHPPSLVSLLDPGEICCSPQPSFPFLSIT